MKKLLVIAVMWATAAVAQQTTTSTDTAAKPPDSPLVKAAKASGGKRKPKGKVITNADVKKSAGQLTVLPDSKATITLKTSDPQKSPLKTQEEQRKAADEAARRVSLAETKVAHLESDLASIEQSYYESNDPNDRDANIRKQFELKKQQLEGARKELAEARDVQAKLIPSAKAK